jgi:hypothetical protein
MVTSANPLLESEVLEAIPQVVEGDVRVRCAAENRQQDLLEA